MFYMCYSIKVDKQNTHQSKDKQMTNKIENSLMQHTCHVTNTLQVWFRKESDAIAFLNQAPPDKRAMHTPLRISKWADSNFRVNLHL